MAVKHIPSAWWIIAKNNFQMQLLTPSSSVLFIVGKLLNFIFTIFIIQAVFTTTSTIKGYTLNQALVVVIFFNFVESLTGFLFRSIYTFRSVLLRGDYDLDLLRPLPAFFRPILSGPDFLDLPPLLIQLVVFLAVTHRFYPDLPISQYFLFLVLLLISVTVVFSIHLSIAAFSILTTEVENLVWIYRSLTRAGSIPTDIYSGLFRFILDFVVPVTLIVTIPAKGLLGLLSFQTIPYIVLTTLIFLGLSVWFWRYSLRHYTSAGS